MTSGRFPHAFVGPAVGLLTAAAALAFAEVTAVLAGVSAPVVTVADAVVDTSPPWLVEGAVSLFGTADKAVLFGGVALVLTVGACLLGAAALRRPRAGYAGLAVFAAAGAGAVWLRRADDPASAVPVLVGAVAGAGALALLLRAERGFGVEEADAEDRGGQGPRRRGFVGTSFGVLAGAGAAGVLGRWLASVEGARAAVPELPAAAEPLPPLAAGTDLRVPGLAPFSTPTPDFYRIDTALTVPRLDPHEWTLRVHGMVDRPFEIDMGELLSRPLVEADITLSCVSNPVGGELVGNSRWLGARLAELLREAGVRSGADQILSTSSDGWTCGTPTEVVMDGRDALLAVGMDGQALPREHGYPARMVVPGLYGYVSATKWVTDIKLTRFADEEAYWRDRGWAERGPVKTASRIDVPGAYSHVEPGGTVLAGVAWAPHTGIAAVEVRVDEGDWWEAELAAVPGIDTWVQWVAETTLEPGFRFIEVRATDTTGFTQSPVPVETVPDGAEGWHRIRVRVE